MSSTSRDDATLLDISRAGRRVAEFLHDVDETRFLRDHRTQAAVQYQLLVIGEAVKRLSEPFRAAHTSVPWRLIAGMRDRLIHGYDEVDVAEVWRAARHDVPELLDKLSSVMPKREAP